MLISFATEDDLPELAEAIAKASLELSEYGSPDMTPAVIAGAHYGVMQEQAVVVARDQAGVCGFVVWVWFEGVSAPGMVDGLGTWVSPDHRRTGLSGAMRELAERRCVEAGKTDVHGIVAIGNDAGRVRDLRGLCAHRHRREEEDPMIVVPSLLADHPWLLQACLLGTVVVGWTTILIGTLIGAGLSATASGIQQGIKGDFDVGRFFRDMGIGAGTGGLTAGLGSVIGSAMGTGASAASSAGSNAAAVPVEAAGATGIEGTSEVIKDTAAQVGQEATRQSAEKIGVEAARQATVQAAAQAPAGTYGATGTAVANGAMSPAGASGALSGATSSADLARSIGNMVPNALKEAGVPQAQQALTQTGNALAASGVPGGPSYPAFQQATSLARSGVFAPSDYSIASAAAPTQTVGQKIASQAIGNTFGGAASGYANNPRDWRGPVYGALAGGVSGGLGAGTSASLAGTLGQQAAGITGRVVGSTVGGAINGLQSDDPINGALTGAASGAVGSGISGGLGAGWKAINPSEPLLPLKEVDGWKGIPYQRDNEPVADFARTLGSPTKAFGAITDYRYAGPGDDQYAQALGVRGMKTVENQLTGAASGMASNAVAQAIRKPTQVMPLLPSSGPAMYAANRALSGVPSPMMPPYRRF